ncbi:MAG TPA: hypothetical protein PK522_00855 [Nitrosomonas sp.]|nr:hypothetical protein [Nitrosomonas sp.]
MKRSEFAEQMGRLIDVYGEKSYPSPRTDLIYNWASKMQVESFSQIVSKLIAECDRPPLLNKFKDAHQELGILKNRPIVDCVYCGGTGFICDDAPLPTVKRCICEAGDEKTKYIARFKGFPVAAFPSQAKLAEIRQAASDRAAKLIKQTMLNKTIPNDNQQD